MKKYGLLILSILLFISCNDKELIELQEKYALLEREQKDNALEIEALKNDNDELTKMVIDLKSEISDYKSFINQSEALKMDYRYTGIFKPQNVKIEEAEESQSS